MGFWRGFLPALAALAFQSAPAAAQSSEQPQQDSAAPAVDPASAAPPPAASDAQALAKQLSNPIASLISFPMQSNYDWGMGPDGDGTQYKLNVQPVIPIALSDKWNLISRTIVPIIAQNDVVPPILTDGDDDQFGIGDTAQSLFFSPQKPAFGKLIWGVGPVILIPTATNDFLGGKKWGVGPSAVALTQTGPWTIGGLVNHIWSVAGDDDRNDISLTFLQPFLTYTTPKAMTFAINTESTYDWKNEQWTVPVNLTVAQLLPPKITGIPFPIQLQVGYRHYFEKAPGGPEDGVRFAIVALFPKAKK
jgi:hypothetical protein